MCLGGSKWSYVACAWGEHKWSYVVCAISYSTWIFTFVNNGLCFVRKERNEYLILFIRK